MDTWTSYKAPGPDGSSIQLIKCMREHTDLVSAPSSLFTAIFINFTIPTSWRLFHTKLTQKNYKLYNTSPDSFRPIGLSPILRLIFEKCLKPHVTQRYQAHRCQQGFHKHRSTLGFLLYTSDSSEE